MYGLLPQVLIVIGAWALIAGVGVPVALKLQHRLATPPETTPADWKLLPDHLCKYVEQAHKDLVALGFVETGALRLHLHPDVIDLRQTLYHPEKNAGAIVVVSYNPIASGWAGVEISTELSDGTEIDTHNMPPLPLLPISPRKKIITARSLRDPAVLFALHQDVVARSGAESKPMRLDESPALLLQRSLEEVANHWREERLMWLDRRSSAYRLTWRGAFYIGWRSVWPVTQIRNIRARRRERALLR